MSRRPPAHHQKPRIARPNSLKPKGWMVMREISTMTYQREETRASSPGSRKITHHAPHRAPYAPKLGATPARPARTQALIYPRRNRHPLPSGLRRLASKPISSSNACFSSCKQKVCSVESLAPNPLIVSPTNFDNNQSLNELRWMLKIQAPASLLHCYCNREVYI